MAVYQAKKLVCALLESLMFDKLSLKEKESLLLKVAENYPSAAEAEEERALGYESSGRELSICNRQRKRRDTFG